MKKRFYIIWLLIFALVGCKDDDVNVFDKTADERVSEAVASLKADLVAPANGWRLKYKPTPESGSFYVLLNFKENNQLIIRSDLAANDGKYQTDTLTYRIDNSLGLELIFETYSFFSYLFEQGSATFEAEYEFNYVNKTPDNALVFRSKTDISSTPTLLVFEEAGASDENLLGIDVASNLDLMSQDLNMLIPSYKIVFQNKDLILYASLDLDKRQIEISSASKKTNPATTSSVSFEAGYLIKGDSIVFDNTLSGTFAGSAVNFKSIALTTLTDTEINICADPIPSHSLSGKTSANDLVTLEPSYVNAAGKQFAAESTFYFIPLVYIYEDGVSARTTIVQDIEGALEFDLIYDPTDDDYRIGFYLQSADGSYSFAYREFVPVLDGNNLKFNLQPGLKIGGNASPDADVNEINAYIELLAQNTTYVFKVGTGVYEFNNPCTGWSFVAINAN
jgi:hypothetical protein